MNVIRSIEVLRANINQYRQQNLSVGLVPTMGYLHEGHAHLIRTSCAENDITIVTIFVNPLQFNNESDLEKYPRSEEEDFQLIAALGAAVVFAPNHSEVYPEKPQLSMNFGSLEENLEGAFRPGHFKGVGIVVSKLFNFVQPDKAYFGLKDLQQYMIINRMVRDLSFPVDIVGIPTVRTETGLALSSRNSRLSEEGLVIASEIYQGLNVGKDVLFRSGLIADALNAVNEFFLNIKEIEIEYVSIVDPYTFQEIETFSPTAPVAICVAAYVEGIRLIDNLYLRPDSL